MTPEPPDAGLRFDRQYRRTVRVNDRDVCLRPMLAADEEAMLAFARALPEEDLLFLENDITQPAVVAEWIEASEEGRRYTLLAEEAGKLVGYGSLNRQDLHWTRHQGEIRVIVSPSHRELGLGSILAREILDVARQTGLSKIVAQMPRDQDNARAVFRKLGFDLESMLADWVIDREGNTHDLVIMGYEIAD